MLRLTPPIARVALCEYRLDQPHAPADLSIPLPPPRQRQNWGSLLGLGERIDQCLRLAGGVLREPWLEFDFPYGEEPGVGFRMDSSRGCLRQAATTARQRLTPTFQAPVPWPQLPQGSDLRVSHFGLFPARSSHGQGRIRINLIGLNQWLWLQEQTPHLCTTGLSQLLALDCLCWSATFDWGSDGMHRLGFELFPAGRLQRGSSYEDPGVQALVNALKPWIPPGALERCMECHHNWHQQFIPTHAKSFSHIKLKPGADDTWSLKLYLLSHATR